MKKLIFTHCAGCRAVDGHVFALDGSFREFLVDDDRLCAHTVTCWPPLFNPGWWREMKWS